MKQLTSICCALLLCTGLWAQQITLKHENTQKPIKGVTVSNTQLTHKTITNAEGNINLSGFSETDKLRFVHPDFIPKQVSYARALKLKTILLTPKEDIQDLNEVVISVSKFEQQRFEIPQAVDRLTQEEIDFANPQTSADLLAETGNVYIQKSQQGGGSPMIRGFSTNRLLITVDGVRMNNAIFRSGNLQNVISIDPLSVKNVEVILGPGAIIYGSDAIGGVMSFQTQSPELSDSEEWLFKSFLKGRYASANDEKTIHGQFNFGHKKWAFLTQITYNDFGDLRMGSHGPTEYLRPEFVVTDNGEDIIIKNDNLKDQRPTAYNQLNLMQKVRFQPEDDLKLDLGLIYTTTSNYPRYDRLIRYRGTTLRSAEWHYGPQRWFLSYLTAIDVNSDSNIYDKMIATAAYQNFQESRIDRNFQSDTRNEREEMVSMASLNLDFEKRLSMQLSLFYGGEYVFNYINSDGSEFNTTTQTYSDAVSRYPDGSTWQSAAAYTSLKYSPISELVIQSGIRYNYIKTKSDFTANNTFLNLPFNTSEINSDAVTGNIGAYWTPNSIIQWRVNFSTAFRAPNIDDIGKVFDSEPGSVVVPNNNLKPEYAYNGELGLTLNAGETLQINLATYYTYLEDALVRRDFSLNGETEILYDNTLSTVQAIQNASESRTHGFEAGLKLKFNEQWLLSSQYNVLGGYETVDGVNSPVRHVAPNFGNTHLVFNYNNLKLDAFVVYNGELSNNQLAVSEQSKDYIYALDENNKPFSPSWYTLNLRSQLYINNSITLTATLENITDQRYKTYSSGIASAGRNFIVSFQYQL